MASAELYASLHLDSRQITMPTNTSPRHFFDKLLGTRLQNYTTGTSLPGIWIRIPKSNIPLLVRSKKMVPDAVELQLLPDSVLVGVRGGVTAEMVLGGGLFDHRVQLDRGEGARLCRRWRHREQCRWRQLEVLSRRADTPLMMVDDARRRRLRLYHRLDDVWHIK